MSKFAPNKKVIHINNKQNMKKIAIMLALLLAVAGVQADNKYLVFQRLDGTETPVASEGLVITFSDGKLVTNKELELAVSELNKMFFAESVGISELLADELNTEVRVFLPSGVECGTFHNAQIARATLRPGVYVMRTKSKSVKVIVK